MSATRTASATRTPGARREFLLRQGDTALILGQRLSEWCGRAPVLEEDIALANVALDLVGAAQLWLGLAAEGEETADTLAFRRDAWDFRNLLLVERPNLDFGHTILRQYLFDAFQVPHLAAMAEGTDPAVAEIAAKTLKEARYHLDRSRGTVIALGDGTEESHDRMQTALVALWPYAGEMLTPDEVDREMAAEGVCADPSDLREGWEAEVRGALAEATLTVPEDGFAHMGGKTGKRHSEHLGHMLTTMQWLQRSYPDAVW